MNKALLLALLLFTPVAQAQEVGVSLNPGVTLGEVVVIDSDGNEIVIDVRGLFFSVLYGISQENLSDSLSNKVRTLFSDYQKGPFVTIKEKTGCSRNIYFH